MGAQETRELPHGDTPISIVESDQRRASDTNQPLASYEDKHPESEPAGARRPTSKSASSPGTVRHGNSLVAHSAHTRTKTPTQGPPTPGKTARGHSQPKPSRTVNRPPSRRGSASRDRRSSKPNTTTPAPVSGGGASRPAETTSPAQSRSQTAPRQDNPTPVDVTPNTVNKPTDVMTFDELDEAYGGILDLCVESPPLAQPPASSPQAAKGAGAPVAVRRRSREPFSLPLDPPQPAPSTGRSVAATAPTPQRMAPRPTLPRDMPYLSAGALDPGATRGGSQTSFFVTVADTLDPRAGTHGRQPPAATLSDTSFFNDANCTASSGPNNGTDYGSCGEVRYGLHTSASSNDADVYNRHGSVLSFGMAEDVPHDACSKQAAAHAGDRNQCVSQQDRSDGARERPTARPPPQFPQQPQQSPYTMMQGRPGMPGFASQFTTAPFQRLSMGGSTHNRGQMSACPPSHGAWAAQPGGSRRATAPTVATAVMQDVRLPNMPAQHSRAQLYPPPRPRAATFTATIPSRPPPQPQPNLDDLHSSPPPTPDQPPIEEMEAALGFSLRAVPWVNSPQLSE